MQFVFPSPLTTVKPHKKKCQIIFSKLSLRYGEMSPKCGFWRDGYCVQQEKMMDSNYCEEYLKSTSNKILLWQC